MILQQQYQRCACQSVCLLFMAITLLTYITYVWVSSPVSVLKTCTSVNNTANEVWCTGFFAKFSITMFSTYVVVQGTSETLQMCSQHKQCNLESATECNLYPSIFEKGPCFQTPTTLYTSREPFTMPVGTVMLQFFGFLSVGSLMSLSCIFGKHAYKEYTRHKTRLIVTRNTIVDADL